MCRAYNSTKYTVELIMKTPLNFKTDVLSRPSTFGPKQLV